VFVLFDEHMIVKVNKYTNMRKILITAGCVIFSVMSASRAVAADLNFSQFFVFGDSVSDTGNLSAATKGARPVATTTSGQTAYFQGLPSQGSLSQTRFSNGPIWVDYFGDAIGKKPTPSLLTPFLGTKGGVNYAIGGAETSELSTNVPVPGILGQVSSFLGQSGVPVDSNAIYSILGGANDYTSAIDNKRVPNVSQVVSNLTESINRLANKNAKNFLVFNLPNLGDTPRYSANREAQPLLNALTQDHNRQLAIALNDVRSKRPDLNIYTVDFNSLFQTLRSNPSPPAPFGFTIVNRPCLDGNNELATGVCNNPNEFLFFDDVHPSSEAHRLLANTALASIKGGSKSIPEPSMGLGLLALAGFGATRVVKRKNKKLVLK
jgi:phospholipase/lecithinase/hemolysin